MTHEGRVRVQGIKLPKPSPPACMPKSRSFARGPIRTTEMAHRDKRASQPKSLLKRAVSGSESTDLNRQHPAISRAFPDPFCDPSGKSLHPQPGWRWTESGGNCSVGGGGVWSEFVSAD